MDGLMDRWVSLSVSFFFDGSCFVKVKRFLKAMVCLIVMLDGLWSVDRLGCFGGIGLRNVVLDPEGEKGGREGFI